MDLPNTFCRLIAPLLILIPYGCLSRTIDRARQVPVVETTSPSGDKLPQGWSVGGDDPVGAWVVMKRQLDLDALGRRLRSSNLRKRERRDAVRAALESVAEDRRRGIDRDLRHTAGVVRVEGLTIVNGLILWADREVVRKIAEREDVAYILREEQSERGVWASRRGLPSVGGGDRGPLSAGGTPQGWWLEEIGARRAWEMGVTGRGVVMGLIDSGASAGHEQTRGGFRGGADSWYDPAGEAARPVETHPFSHGTSVIGLAAGRGGADHPKGVAPGARWVAALGFPGGKYHNLHLALCADWMLRRGRPDILIAAWEIPGSKCDVAFDRILSAFRTSEIFVLFAAGNHGPGPGTNRSPANSTGLSPDGGISFSVGGTTPGGKRLPETSEGPNLCDPTAVFPRVCAPGIDLEAPHGMHRSLYTLRRGTSFSVALAAGGAALLLECDPELAVQDLEAALIETAADMGPPGPDPVFGNGMIQLHRAVQWVRGRGR